MLSESEVVSTGIRTARKSERGNEKKGRGDTLPRPGLVEICYLLKLACAVTLLLIVRVQVFAVPEQALLQPRNVFPSGGVAVRVTTVPALYFAEQVLPQLMPATSLVIVPGLLRPTCSVN